MKLVWSPLAVDRLSEIARYIALDNVAAAEKWVEHVFQKVKRLKDFPESGRRVPEVNRPDIREIVDKNHRIIYRVHPREISILTIRHSRQILPAGEFSE